ncbi:hypothetical protein ASPZODRAFT_169366 [Penicilliopsis zonata CBS 506.65]|uniref:Mitochondrial 54S ribosomal protein YmL20 n=1 Tax=Penicilliopsis zonata CBS 506.65 TaxID=1073090 RepID=A0A1L9S853_9EURO|nr:hypothetical protein ASPZODRAFT_169366 [Penicilliopsis zonata CBS 506.65]OJJ43341.1 hypothetical protein ASPZODRAFT_169366 [Penicilliopsis zonata CBS 506.65]
MAHFIAVSKRPSSILPFLLPSWSESTVSIQQRNQSSYRRTTQRLRLKPDSSFGLSTDQIYDHIIHNPPSSAPSVYHTPTKFLPPGDVRSTLRAGTSVPNSEALPTLFKSDTTKKYHLKQSDIEEIRRLRLSDPMSWSRWKLAKRFECSPLFIAMVCEASPEKKEIQKKVLEAVQSRWGIKRRIAREDRQLRKETWGRE